MQDKGQEKDFFNRFTAHDEYDVLTESAYKTFIRTFLSLSGAMTDENYKIVDLGCGTGNFTRKLKQHWRGTFFGLDISMNAVVMGSRFSSEIHMCVGDIEFSCFKDNSVDIVLFSGVLHHFDDFDSCLREGYRMLKPGGYMLSYDPNRHNPFMWLYRAPESPFYSSRGRTVNEHLLTKQQIASSLDRVGFRQIKIKGIGGVTFRYLESRLGRLLLPIYNCCEVFLGLSPLANRIGSFLIAYGQKESDLSDE
ncbi:class I SAM-dependent methyltransferase [bacterium]|nr:class I SAM-dependent methyltransferase [bacterium]